MRLRAAALAALAAVTALTVPASAASRRVQPQVRDPKGDVRGDVSGSLAYLDVLSGQWKLTGSGANAALTAVMTLAAPPKTDRGYTYELWADVEDCGSVWFYYAPGTVLEAVDDNAPPSPATIADNDGAAMYLACGKDGTTTILDKRVTFTITGSTLTWSIKLTDLPEDVQPGALFRSFRAFSDVADPVFGKAPTTLVDQCFDLGTGDGTWRMR